MSLSRDPIINVIESGFKRDINMLLENKGYRGALILIYSAIDAITFSSSPKGKISRDDFINWCDRYIKIIGIEESKHLYRINGIDLYSARCSIVHTYGHHLESDLSKAGKCCIIGYMTGRIKQDFHSAKTSVDNTNGSVLVLASIYDLSDALFKGINDFLIELYKNKVGNKDRIKVFEDKIGQYIHEIHINEIKP